MEDQVSLLSNPMEVGAGKVGVTGREDPLAPDANSGGREAERRQGSLLITPSVRAVLGRGEGDGALGNLPDPEWLTHKFY
ncbi:hypothetical protein [Sorangium sp. So ce1000]|uniref:hypothetical protein n=1 Tax=Sorangium sp. So ce1000 TaxID=3133325 RepID=UPI003F60FA7A